MRESDPINQFDTIVIGAGVLGLWAARYAVREGRKVCVVEKSQIGAGASGGVLGALMGHQPDNWNRKKAFQFEALGCLEQHLQILAKDTGLDAGYRRCGRITPIRHRKMVHQVERWLEGAKQNWRAQYQMTMLENGHPWFTDQQWPIPEFAEFGACMDELAARCNPRKVMKALGRFAVEQTELLEGRNVASVDAAQGQVVLEDGTRLVGDEIVVAAGLDAYRLLYPYLGNLNNQNPIGRGVYGQAIVIEYEHDDTLPILYRDGVYIVPHEENRMAIGSTSHNIELSEISAEHYRYDEEDSGFYNMATEMAPALKDAPIVEKWAGVRPRNTLTGMSADPWFGPVPGHYNLIALMGGFKITFGIAHLAMAVARGRIEGPQRQWQS